MSIDNLPSYNQRIENQRNAFGGIQNVDHSGTALEVMRQLQNSASTSSFMDMVNQMWGAKNQTVGTVHPPVKPKPGRRPLIEVIGQIGRNGGEELAAEMSHVISPIQAGSINESLPRGAKQARLAKIVFEVAQNISTLKASNGTVGLARKRYANEAYTFGMQHSSEMRKWFVCRVVFNNPETVEYLWPDMEWRFIAYTDETANAYYTAEVAGFMLAQVMEKI